ncbi:unnamed protein product [Urochloa decumbens]|uniref:Uncharacterized protein n=1 Tax=Urochloa decumbens TaxID=240449 RepID=A0ABC9AL55_9POAL
MRPPTSSSSSGVGGSTSTLVADTVTGWHVFRIDCYSATKAHGVGKYRKSSTFNVGGHNWYLAYYPDGHEEYSDGIRFALFLLDDPLIPNDGVNAQFMLSLLNQAGKPVPQYTVDCGTRRFTSKKPDWGCSNFITWKYLESSVYLKDDSFSIRCDLTVVMDIRTVATGAESPVVPPSDLHQHLGDLFTSKVGGDVAFYVGDKQFTAHRAVLAARSKVFMAELFGPMKEQTDTGVSIDDMESNVFEAMLHFIYTDTLPKIDKGDKMLMAQHLLVAADRYNLERLKLICQDILSGYINVDIAATTLVMAEQHSCQKLKEACFRFLEAPGNLKAVMASDGYQHLKTSCPSLVEDLLAMAAPLICSRSTPKKPRLK